MVAEEVTYEARKYQSFPKWDNSKKSAKIAKKEPIRKHADLLF
jgi:hypothetical protein